MPRNRKSSFRALHVIGMSKMSTRTGSLTQTQSVRSTTLGLLVKSPCTKEQPSASPSYQIEEREPFTIPVPFDSRLAIAAHFTTWICWALYLIVRLPSSHQATIWWPWLLYACEVAFVLQDFQAALELTFSIFGPARVFHYSQYSLKGTQAPRVSILIT